MLPLGFGVADLMKPALAITALFTNVHMSVLTPLQAAHAPAWISDNSRSLLTPEVEATSRDGACMP
jgi:hypothetical protein